MYESIENVSFKLSLKNCRQRFKSNKMRKPKEYPHFGYYLF